VQNLILPLAWNKLITGNKLMDRLASVLV